MYHLGTLLSMQLQKSAHNVDHVCSLTRSTNENHNDLVNPSFTNLLSHKNAELMKDY